jgi:hypothetical protein
VCWENVYVRFPDILTFPNCVKDGEIHA